MYKPLGGIKRINRLPRHRQVKDTVEEILGHILCVLVISESLCDLHQTQPVVRTYFRENKANTVKCMTFAFISCTPFDDMYW